MTRFTDSPYERMMTREAGGREGNFPSSFFTTATPAMAAGVMEAPA